MSSANGSSGSIGIEGDSAGTGEAWATLVVPGSRRSAAR